MFALYYEASVQFNHSVESNSLQLHRLQHIRLPCPSPSARVCSNSCPLSQWCHLNHLIPCCPLLLLPSIFLSITVFSSESALCIMWPKYWSFSFSISPFNEYSGSFPSGSTGLISLQSKGLLGIFSRTTIWKYKFFYVQPSLWPSSHIVHDNVSYGKNRNFDYMDLFWQSDVSAF